MNAGALRDSYSKRYKFLVCSFLQARIRLLEQNKIDKQSVIAACQSSFAISSFSHLQLTGTSEIFTWSTNNESCTWGPWFSWWLMHNYSNKGYITQMKKAPIGSVIVHNLWWWLHIIPLSIPRRSHNSFSLFSLDSAASSNATFACSNLKRLAHKDAKLGSISLLFKIHPLHLVSWPQLSSTSIPALWSPTLTSDSAVRAAWSGVVPTCSHAFLPLGWWLASSTSLWLRW